MPETPPDFSPNGSLRERANSREASSKTTAELMRSLQEDQRRRLFSGERISIEAYRERDPSLRTEAHTVVEFIANELEIRTAYGEHFSAAARRNENPRAW